MADRLALEERANQRTQAQVFAAAAETGLLPAAVPQMVDHHERERRLLEATQITAAVGQVSS